MSFGACLPIRSPTSASGSSRPFSVGPDWKQRLARPTARTAPVVVAVVALHPQRRHEPVEHSRLAEVLPAGDPVLDLIEVEMREQGFWRDRGDLLAQLEDDDGLAA